jgi:hypothetical protein
VTGVVVDFCDSFFSPEADTELEVDDADTGAG